MLIENFNISKHNDICLDVIGQEITQTYSLIEGESSYRINREFLFKPKLKDLLTEIQVCINTYLNRIDMEPAVVSSSWFNILGKNGVVKKHRHVESWEDEEGSVVSGAYYPFVEEDSAELIFSFPDKKVTITPESGALVIFPSWVDHYTEINMSEKRITVSFNTVRKSVVFRKFPESVKMADERLKNDIS